MSEISTVHGIVLKKLEFGDTSHIITLYTKEHGKLSAIIKGSRSSKSKMGNKVDVMNLVEVVLYKKKSREVQVISQVDLINPFSKIKEDLEKLKYGTGILELLLSLVPEDDVNERLFYGTVKALEKMNVTEKIDANIFAKYLLFFIKETGYEIQLEYCTECNSDLHKSRSFAFKPDQGILCDKCKNLYDFAEEIGKEHFDLLNCLNTKNYCEKFKKRTVTQVIKLLEKYLIYHIPEFKGIKSFHYY